MGSCSSTGSGHNSHHINPYQVFVNLVEECDLTIKNWVISGPGDCPSVRNHPFSRPNQSSLDPNFLLYSLYSIVVCIRFVGGKLLELLN